MDGREGWFGRSESEPKPPTREQVADLARERLKGAPEFMADLITARHGGKHLDLAGEVGNFIVTNDLFRLKDMGLGGDSKPGMEVLAGPGNKTVIVKIYVPDGEPVELEVGPEGIGQ